MRTQTHLREAVAIVLVYLMLGTAVFSQDVCTNPCHEPPPNPNQKQHDAAKAIVTTNMPKVNNYLVGAQPTVNDYETAATQIQTYINDAATTGYLNTLNAAIKANWHAIVSASPDATALYNSFVATTPGYRGTLADVQAFIAGTTQQDRIDITTWAFNSGIQAFILLNLRPTHYIPPTPLECHIWGQNNAQLALLGVIATISGAPELGISLGLWYGVSNVMRMFACPS